jgi:hypothetical protein
MSIQPGPGYTFSSSSLGTALTIQQPWAPWTTYATTEDPGHPFKIVNVQIGTSGGSPVVRYQVQSGIINNLVPKIDDYVSGTEVLLNRVTSGVADPPTAELVSSNYDATTLTSYITLRAGAKTTSPYNYPDDIFSSNQYPVIIGGNTFPVTPDDNVWGFLVIGTITVDSITAPTTFTVAQNVTGSLWADRIKLGTTTARYYYARI